ncbi:MAG: carbohydrate-binding domain-containing protein, partial [Victivallales bacterium]|nr:carbohydrate-binding domain-containing protein [Victivallales bacterium]
MTRKIACIFASLICAMLCSAYTTDNATFFEFSDTGVTVTEGKYTGYKTSGAAVTLNGAGTYVFSGECSDGSIKVAKATTGTVRIVLAGLTLTNTGTETTAVAPLLVNKSNTVVIEAFEGTTNTLA